MAKLPVRPKNPERICWGCDKYCPADSLACGNGTIRTQHPVELFGDDWMEWEVAPAEAQRDQLNLSSANENPHPGQNQARVGHPNLYQILTLSDSGK